MNAELKKELEEHVEAIEEFKGTEEYKQLDAMQTLIPAFKGIIDLGKMLGKAEVAKKVLETPCNCGGC